ncbi:MAG: hypothetical protein ACLU4J_17830 [Butyricimonas paravirosa]
MPEEPEHVNRAAGTGNAAFDELVKRFETIKEKNESYRLRVAFDVSYEFVKGLTFKSSLSADYSQQTSNCSCLGSR